LDRLDQATNATQGYIGVIRYHIHILGRVQGVGFRPFIFREASRRNLKGWVSNTKDGAHIEVLTKDLTQVKALCDFIKSSCPEQAIIEELKFWQVPFRNADSFEIKLSSNSGNTNITLTPDFAICDQCKQELEDPGNKRYLYPFITCTNCGPRFSIIKQIPYDRGNTTMDHFRMCSSCKNEYMNPMDRRFFSQTNSCSDCPVKITLFDSEGNQKKVSQSEIISFISTAILEGKIIAVKGIGGFLLMADATSASAMENLRKRKHRPSKPFALMYPDIETAEKDVYINTTIKQMWCSPESPIILCLMKDHLSSAIIPEIIAPGLNRIGIMIPYTPLFLLIMKGVNKPIVATSGNISGSPIIYEDEMALEYLSEIADYLLVNNRDIVMPQDDSVIQFSINYNHRIILRRSRGIAPGITLKGLKYYLGEPVLAMGAMLKSAFGMYHNGRFYISQYLGDTSTLESQESFEKTIKYMNRVLDFKPAIVLVDQHPDYPSTISGETIASEFDIPVLKIQHHEAHAYAVLAENNLLNKKDILCVIWDGTGMGKDHHIWGGEFFIYQDKKLNRSAHWSYFSHIAGDKMALEPRLSLLSFVHHVEYIQDIVKNKFTNQEWTNYTSIIQKNSIKTSSVGRLFDAVASLLGISDINSYEGESALYLESEAISFLIKNPGYDLYYDQLNNEFSQFDTYSLMREITNEYIHSNIDRSEIALKFHITLAKMIETYAKKQNIFDIAFSGGVFQNGLLIDLIYEIMDNKFNLYFHKELSPNDECISFGQLMYYYTSKNLKENVLQVNHKIS